MFCDIQSACLFLTVLISSVSLLSLLSLLQEVVLTVASDTTVRDVVWESCEVCMTSWNWDTFANYNFM